MDRAQAYDERLPLPALAARVRTVWGPAHRSAAGAALVVQLAELPLRCLDRCRRGDGRGGRPGGAGGGGGRLGGAGGLGGRRSTAAWLPTWAAEVRYADDSQRLSSPRARLTGLTRASSCSATRSTRARLRSLRCGFVRSVPAARPRAGARRAEARSFRSSHTCPRGSKRRTRARVGVPCRPALDGEADHAGIRPGVRRRAPSQRWPDSTTCARPPWRAARPPPRT